MRRRFNRGEGAVRNVGTNRIMFGLAALCFILAVFGVALGTLNLIALGLAFLALGHFL
jgi:hypothetical protein